MLVLFLAPAVVVGVCITVLAVWSAVGDGAEVLIVGGGTALGVFVLVSAARSTFEWSGGALRIQNLRARYFRPSDVSRVVSRRLIPLAVTPNVVAVVVKYGNHDRVVPIWGTASFRRERRVRIAKTFRSRFGPAKVSLADYESGWT